ncbi:MAG: hypothetical protein GC178_14090 [Flavobacteriales bacterium]|nr:hypothetical protein [Flavobacteriales bacterium]
MKKIASFLAMTLICVSGLFAQNATITATLDSQQILIGDQVNLDLSATLNDGVTVAWPVFKDTITGQLEIIQSSIPDTVKKETGETVIHQRLVLTTFDTGFVIVPPIHFVFNQDSTQMLSTEAQMLFVSDIPVEMEADIKDIKERLDVPYNWKKLLTWAAIILAVLALIIGGILYWMKHRKKEEVPVARPKPKRPAHEIALEKLEALRQKKLWQSDQTKEYYIELSDIIREYAEFRFGVIALEMTTEETVAALRLRGVSEQHVGSLKQMLQMADLAKFAKYKPVSNENEQCFDIAVQFVNNTLVMPLDEPKEEEKEQ